jgi:hypothetical protein
MRLKHVLAAAAFAASSMFSVAQAAVILTFGQNVNGNTVQGTATATGTTITAVNVPVTITQINAGIATPFDAILNYQAQSTGGAAVAFGAAGQLFDGTFTITSGAGGTGTNYLSAVFKDNLVSGFPNGTGLTLLATDPPGVVNFTSDVIGGLLDPSTISLGLSAVTPAVSIVTLSGGIPTLDTFKGSIAGTNSAVPEPGTIALLGLAVLAFAFSRRSKASQDKKASFEPSYA